MRDRFATHQLAGSAVASVWAIGFLDPLSFRLQCNLDLINIIIYKSDLLWITLIEKTLKIQSISF
jgi:hypothetical protein